MIRFAGLPVSNLRTASPRQLREQEKGAALRSGSVTQVASNDKTEAGETTFRGGRRSPGATMRSGRSASRTTVVAAPSSGSEDSEWEEERVARLRERAWRDGPRGPGSGGKGRSRRSREQRTNWRVPAGHERKITAKIRASLAKRRLQQRPGRGPRSAPLQPRKRAEAGAKVRGLAG